MPMIQYCGPFDHVDVPRYQLANIPHGVPFEVSQGIADDLTTQAANWAASPDDVEE